MDAVFTPSPGTQPVNDNSSNFHNNWYADVSGMVNPTYPWFGRGGSYDYGAFAGQFNFNGGTGGPSGRNGTRLVLTN